MGRQIALQYWMFFLAGLLIFSLIFLVADILGNSSQFAGIDRKDILQYYFYMLPEIIYRMTPIATLMGVVFTLNQLQRTHELMALFSLGISLVQLTQVLLFWALITGFINLYLGDQVVPKSIQNKNYTFYHLIKKKPDLYATVKTGKIWYKVKETIFYLQTLNPEAQRAEGVKLFMFSPEWTFQQLIEAKSVVFEGDKWHLSEGVVTLFSNQNSFPMSKEFNKKTIIMSEEVKDLAETAKPSDVLTMAELRKFIARNKDAGLDTLRYEVDYFGKWAFAFAGCVMALLGIPFSIAKNRGGGAMSSVGVVLGLVFVYWTFYSAGIALGYHGRMTPLLAAFAPSGLIVIFAIRRIQKSGR